MLKNYNILKHIAIYEFIYTEFIYIYLSLSEQIYDFYK